MPRQLEGCSCFIRKLQQTWMTCESWRRQAAASKLSMVSSFSSRTPTMSGQVKKIRKKTRQAGQGQRWAKTAAQSRFKSAWGINRQRRMLIKWTIMLQPKRVSLSCCTLLMIKMADMLYCFKQHFFQLAVQSGFVL